MVCGAATARVCVQSVQRSMRPRHDVCASARTLFPPLPTCKQADHPRGLRFCCILLLWSAQGIAALQSAGPSRDRAVRGGREALGPSASEKPLSAVGRRATCLSSHECGAGNEGGREEERHRGRVECTYGRAMMADEEVSSGETRAGNACQEPRRFRPLRGGGRGRGGQGEKEEEEEEDEDRKGGWKWPWTRGEEEEDEGGNRASKGQERVKGQTQDRESGEGRGGLMQRWKDWRISQMRKRRSIALIQVQEECARDRDGEVREREREERERDGGGGEREREEEDLKDVRVEQRRRRGVGEGRGGEERRGRRKDRDRETGGGGGGYWRKPCWGRRRGFLVRFCLWHYFSKVSFALNFYRKYTRALTFEILCQAMRRPL